AFHVTGVQTCALPIFHRRRRRGPPGLRRLGPVRGRGRRAPQGGRRVGGGGTGAAGRRRGDGPRPPRRAGAAAGPGLNRPGRRSAAGGGLGGGGAGRRRGGRDRGEVGADHDGHVGRADVAGRRLRDRLGGDRVRRPGGGGHRRGFGLEALGEVDERRRRLGGGVAGLEHLVPGAAERLGVGAGHTGHGGAVEHDDADLGGRPDGLGGGRLLAAVLGALVGAAVSAVGRALVGRGAVARGGDQIGRA